jgi:flavin reductase (DIM6/NTAB) family NADH-FMN oxidoreductase RutF
MSITPIPVQELALQPFTTFDPGGVLLVAGPGPEAANVMTISWGTFGIMWGRPVVMVMVRPTRHTWRFIEEAPDFTLNWLGDAWTDAVALCGTRSGRDLDKFAATGLTPVSGTIVHAPVLAQAELQLECTVVYRAPVEEARFVVDLAQWYPAKDYHGLFFGELVAATGIDAFRQ